MEKHLVNARRAVAMTEDNVRHGLERIANAGNPENLAVAKKTLEDTLELAHMAREQAADATTLMQAREAATNANDAFIYSQEAFRVIRDVLHGQRRQP